MAGPSGHTSRIELNKLMARLVPIAFGNLPISCHTNLLVTTYNWLILLPTLYM